MVPTCLKFNSPQLFSGSSTNSFPLFTCTFVILPLLNSSFIKYQLNSFKYHLSLTPSLVTFYFSLYLIISIELLLFPQMNHVLNGPCTFTHIIPSAWMSLDGSSQTLCNLDIPSTEKPSLVTPRPYPVTMFQEYPYLVFSEPLAHCNVTVYFSISLPLNYELLRDRHYYFLFVAPRTMPST